jgi:cytochrome c oxidase subunit IV
MLIWCGILFLLGIIAFLDSLFNYGEIFRRVNSVLFMLVSLGLLVRTTTKMRMRITEGYIGKINQLEKEVKKLKVDKPRTPQKVG